MLMFHCVLLQSVMCRCEHLVKQKRRDSEHVARHCVGGDFIYIHANAVDNSHGVCHQYKPPDPLLGDSPTIEIRISLQS